MKTYNKSCCCSVNKNKSIYDIEVMAQGNKPVKLKEYKGKVLLIVNTASKCGFTPQYADLEALNKRYAERGLVILDFPCNQFGGQSPESDEETTKFCQLNYDTTFPQFKKLEVNGANESPLYTYLKAQKGFAGFDQSHPITPKLEQILSEVDPDYASKADIKWNFTKFLVDREGKVVERFEPMTDMATVAKAIEALL
ncbi:MAG: glutathione peroxidase [Alistipes sp.]|nr:glutathione peroxidase [Alistipes sp.]